MSEPQSIRLSDIRAIYRLLGECQELWYDADAWQHHLLQGAARILRARVGHWILCDPNGLTVASQASCGWDNHAEQTTFSSLLSRPVFDVLPELPQYLSQFSAQSFTAFRLMDVMPRQAWLRSVCFDEYFRLANSDPILNSSRVHPHSMSLEYIGVSRPIGDRQFTVRDRRIIATLHAELTPLVGSRLATQQQLGAHRLTPRERQTLEGLLAGCSEKEIAGQLNLSQTTVHDYVRSIYKAFQVNSRSELLSYFIVRRPSNKSH